MPKPLRLGLPALAIALAATAPAARADLTTLSTFPTLASQTHAGAIAAFYGQEFQSGTADLASLAVRIQLDAASLPVNLG